VSEDWVATDDFTPEDTDEAADYAKNNFLDLRKPLMRQMWIATSGMSSRVSSVTVFMY